MKRIAILTAALLLSGCAGFKLGAMLYCPFGASCSMQMLSTPTAERVPAAPAASGVSV